MENPFLQLPRCRVIYICTKLVVLHAHLEKMSHESFLGEMNSTSCDRLVWELVIGREETKLI